MRAMKLSVVIPTHNKRPLLERTLAALLAQDAGTDQWNVVVVDDGSHDDTADVLARLGATEARLRIVTPGVNVGRAAARNLGWRAADGHWVLFLDDDILAPPGLLKAHLGILELGDDRGTIGPATTAPEIVDAPHFHYIDTRGVAKLGAGPAPARYFVTQNAAVPRAALEAIGGFDEDFSAYGFEDMDIGFRLEGAGVRFQVLPEPVPQHIHHHTLTDYLEKKRICGRSSLRQVARRHPDRLAEMRLDLVIDPPGGVSSWPRRWLRALLRDPIWQVAPRLAAAWPTAGHLPVLAPIHARILDACVLAAYCRGLADSDA
jgi:glycosyltransferase involved in cell wall biosynthesis